MVLNRSTRIIVPALALACLGLAPSATAGTIMVTAATDATVTLTPAGTKFDRNFSNPTLELEEDNGIPLDRRIAHDLPLTGLPAGAEVISATLTSQVLSFNTTGGDSTAHLFAYAGDGHISQGDPFKGVPIGSTGPITETGELVINLDVDVINDLLDSGATHLGLVWRGGANTNELSIVSYDGGVQGVGSESVLELEYVPEPASLLMLGGLGLAMCTRRRR